MSDETIVPKPEEAAAIPPQPPVSPKAARKPRSKAWPSKLQAKEAEPATLDCAGHIDQLKIKAANGEKGLVTFSVTSKKGKQMNYQLVSSDAALMATTATLLGAAMAGGYKVKVRGKAAESAFILADEIELKLKR